MAARAPAPVFAAIGPGFQPRVERLAARRDLHLAATPRDAAILLVAGDMPASAGKALSRVHDQLPHPRTTLHWQDAPPESPDDIAQRLVTAWHELCEGRRDEDDHLPDTPPNPWKGVGPHGQGGKGMMGGTPYGRPMAMTGPDVRDGLQLDLYTAQVGPFAPMLPPGLVLEVTLQGDVICDLTICDAPFAQPADADAPMLGAARMLRLLGLEDAARRVMTGQTPGAFLIRHAVPPGLGRIGDADARQRLTAWLAGTSVTVPRFDLRDLLIGAEWSEAALTLASVPPSAILRAARQEEAA